VNSNHACAVDEPIKINEGSHNKISVRLLAVRSGPNYIASSQSERAISALERGVANCPRRSAS